MSGVADGVVRADLRATFHALAWQTVVKQGTDGQTAELTAFGWITQDRRWRDAELYGDRATPIERVECTVWFHPRAEGAPADGETQDVGEGTPTRIGSLIWHGGTDGPYGQPQELYGRIALDPDLHEDLVRRHHDDRPMPPDIDLELPGIPVVGVDGGTRVFMSENAPLPVAVASWRHPPIPLTSRMRWTGESDQPPQVAARIAGISWEHEGWMLQHRQFTLMVGELFASVLEDIRGGRLLWELLPDRIGKAWELATSLYNALLEGERETAKARRALKAKARKRADERPTAYPWRKRTPASDYTQGLDSWSWCGVTKQTMLELAGEYLASGLRSPLMEWVLADALVYTETREFGESMKQTADGLLATIVDGTYYCSGGNLTRMSWRKALRRLPLALVSGGIWYVLPGMAAYGYWSHGQTDSALMVTLGWAAAVTVWPYFLRGLGFGAHSSKVAAERTKLELLQAMVTGYNAVDLAQPPGVVCRQLERAADLGAAWDGPAYAILKRAEERDPAAWWPPGTAADVARDIAQALDRSYELRRKAEGAPPPPDLEESRF